MKTSKQQRIFSLFLALCLLCTLLSGISLTAFAADAQFTVTYSVPDGQTPPDAAVVNEGSHVTLPTEAYTPNGYTFVGWSLSEIREESPSASLLGKTFAPEADTVLYAVYKSSREDYVKVTAEPSDWNGDYLIVCEAAGKAFNGSFGTTLTALKAKGNYLPVNVKDNCISRSDTLDSAIITFKKVSGTENYTLTTKLGLAIGCTGGTTAGAINDGAKNPNSITLNDDKTVKISNINGSTKYSFAYNSKSGTERFAFWGSTGTAVSLFKPTSYYTTEGCKHASATSETIVCTCTEDGKTVYTCPDCGYTWEENVITAPGHDFDAGVVTPATETTFGYTTFTCQREGCGYSEQRDFTGWEWQVTLSNCGTAQDPQAVSSYDGIELPVLEDVNGYAFRGWSAQELDDATDATLLNGLYQPTGDITLYAVYSRNIDNEGDGDYKKVTEDSIVSGGQYLIVNEDNAVALNGNAADIKAKGNYLSGIVISEDTVAQSEDLDKASVTVKPIDGSESYAMILFNGKYVGHTGDSAGISSKETEPYPTDISVTADGAVIADANNNKYIIRYNATEGSEVFKFYSSTTNNKNYFPVSLFYKDGSGYTAYYTTSPNTCTHPAESVTSVYTEPTCTADGYTTYTCALCEYQWTEFSEDTDKALGHDFEGVEAICNNDGTHTRICTRCHQPVTENCKGNYDKETHLCTVCAYPEPYVTVTYYAAGTTTQEKVYGTATLPATAEAPDGYHFVGWSEEPVNEEVTEQPKLCGRTLTPKENITLYAVYVRSEVIGAGIGTGDYVKVSSTEDVTDGKYLIVYEDGPYALDGAKDNSTDITKTAAAMPVSPVSDVITSSFDIDRAAFTVTKKESTYTIQTASEKYIGNTGSKSASGSISINANTQYENTISVEDGVATISNASGDFTYTLFFNAASTSNRFGFFAEGKNTRAVSLYKKDGTGPEMAYYYVSNFATDLEISSASLILNGKIDVEYAAQVPAGYQDVYMVFAMNGTETRVDDNGSHTFVFKGINPQCMGDNISATLYATKEGAEVPETISEETYSIRQYCVNQLANEEVTGELRTLISDLLAYGAAAQTYMGYNTAALVNTGDDIVNPTYSAFTSLPGLTPSFTGTASSEIYWKAAGLTLTNSVAMNFTFYAKSVDGLSVEVKINGRTQTFTSGEGIEAVEGKENTYRVSFTGISANEFGKTVTATVKNGSTPVSNTLSYSVNAYICAKQADSNANLAALVKALYNYGAAAEAYAK